MAPVASSPVSVERLDTVAPIGTLIRISRLYRFNRRSVGIRAALACDGRIRAVATIVADIDTTATRRDGGRNEGRRGGEIGVTLNVAKTRILASTVNYRSRIDRLSHRPDTSIVTGFAAQIAEQKFRLTVGHGQSVYHAKWRVVVSQKFGLAERIGEIQTDQCELSGRGVRAQHSDRVFATDLSVQTTQKIVHFAAERSGRRVHIRGRAFAKTVQHGDVV